MTAENECINCQLETTDVPASLSVLLAASLFSEPQFFRHIFPVFIQINTLLHSTSPSYLSFNTKCFQKFRIEIYEQLRTFRVELEKETLAVSGHSSTRGADERYIHDSRKELLTVLDFCN